MKVVILAGGMGTRLEEETAIIPKPLVSVGDFPILWHIMKIYSSYGFNDFVICLGYKGYLIKEYFANYFLHRCDVTLDFTNGKSEMTFLNNKVDNWRITFVDTGDKVETGGRLRRVRPFLDPKEPFMMTYGDALSTVNITDLLRFHKKHGKMVTVTAVQPPGKFGALEFGKGGKVSHFKEKPAGDGRWINGGFFVLNQGIFKYLKGDSTVWEAEPLNSISRSGQLAAFPHQGFWKCMDTLRDKRELTAMWASGRAEWKVWKEHS